MELNVWHNIDKGNYTTGLSEGEFVVLEESPFEGDAGVSENVRCVMKVPANDDIGDKKVVAKARQLFHANGKTVHVGAYVAYTNGKGKINLRALWEPEGW